MDKQAYWFPHDSGARNDPEMAHLKRLHGFEGVGIYWAVIEILRDATKYEVPLRRVEDIAHSEGFDVAIFDTFFEKDEEGEFIGLLRHNGKVFWSDSLKRRMARLDAKRQKLAKAGRKGGRAKAKGQGVASPQQRLSDAKTSPQPSSSNNSTVQDNTTDPDNTCKVDPKKKQGKGSGTAAPSPDSNCSESLKGKQLAFFEKMKTARLYVRGKGEISFYEAIPDPGKFAAAVGKEEAFPLVDPAVLDRIGAWTIANKKKAKSEISSFAQRWIAREQERGGHSKIAAANESAYTRIVRLEKDIFSDKRISIDRAQTAIGDAIDSGIKLPRIIKTWLNSGMQSEAFEIGATGKLLSAYLNVGTATELIAAPPPPMSEEELSEQLAQGRKVLGLDTAGNTDTQTEKEPEQDGSGADKETTLSDDEEAILTQARENQQTKVRGIADQVPGLHVASDIIDNELRGKKEG